MKVLRHADVSGDDKTVALPHDSEYVKRKVAEHLRAQLQIPVITTGSKEVKISSVEVAPPDWVS